MMSHRSSAKAARVALLLGAAGFAGTAMAQAPAPAAAATPAAAMTPAAMPVAPMDISGYTLYPASDIPSTGAYAVTDMDKTMDDPTACAAACAANPMCDAFATFEAGVKDFTCLTKGLESCDETQIVPSTTSSAFYLSDSCTAEVEGPAVATAGTPAGAAGVGGAPVGAVPVVPAGTIAPAGAVPGAAPVAVATGPAAGTIAPAGTVAGPATVVTAGPTAVTGPGAAAIPGATLVPGAAPAPAGTVGAAATTPGAAGTPTGATGATGSRSFGGAVAPAPGTVESAPNAAWTLPGVSMAAAGALALAGLLA